MNVEQRGAVTMNHGAMVGSILNHFDRATPAQFEAGATWYPRAGVIVRDLADLGRWTPDQAAAVIAHLSPRTDWQTNLSRAYTLAGTGTCTGLTRSVVNAQRAALGTVTFGPSAHKTRAFHANLLGDFYRVTVDTWAVRAAGVEGADLSNDKIYARVEDAYCHAAYLRGVSPATLQAIVWVVIRGKAD